MHIRESSSSTTCASERGSETHRQSDRQRDGGRERGREGWREGGREGGYLGTGDMGQRHALPPCCLRQVLELAQNALDLESHRHTQPQERNQIAVAHRLQLAAAVSLARISSGVSICAFVLVKQVN